MLVSVDMEASEEDNSRSALIRRVVGFAALPGLSMLSALVLLPMVTRYQGAQGWTSLSLGQSIGNVVSVVAGLAWPFIGGNRIAGQNGDDRAVTFMMSLWSRCAVLAPAILIASGFIAVMRPSTALVTILFMIGIAGNSLSSAWFYAGTGRPRDLVFAEGLPRVASYAASVLLMMLTRQILLYAVMTVVAQIVSLAINVKIALKETDGIPRVKVSEVGAELKRQLSGTLARSAVALGVSGGPMLMVSVNPHDLSRFSALDTVYKAGVNATNFLPSAFISIIGGKVSKARRESRIRKALAGILGVCILGVIVWGLLGGVIVRFLYDGKADDSRATVLLIGVSVFVTLFVSTIEVLAMVPLGLSRPLFAVQLWTALAGIGAFMAVARLGATEAFSVYVGIQLTKLVCYIIILSGRDRQHRSGRPSRVLSGRRFL